MKSYYEKLKDPRWQKVRLKIMDRDKFTCLLCNSKDKTLNVHHGYYQKNAEPWEYPEESLHTLCEPCHKSIEWRMQVIRKSIGCLQVGNIERFCNLILYMSDCESDTMLDASKIIDDLTMIVRGWRLAGIEDMERTYREIKDQEDAQFRQASAN